MRVLAVFLSMTLAACAVPVTSTPTLFPAPPARQLVLPTEAPPTITPTPSPEPPTATRTASRTHSPTATATQAPTQIPASDTPRPTLPPPTLPPPTAAPTATPAPVIVPTDTPIPVAGGYVCADGSACIKGNINSEGERIYHFPGCASYNQTRIDEGAGERWFVSSAEAEAAGWRRAMNCP